MIINRLEKVIMVLVCYIQDEKLSEPEQNCILKASKPAQSH
jgi:hypothetical protein